MQILDDISTDDDHKLCIFVDLETNSSSLISSCSFPQVNYLQLGVERSNPSVPWGRSHEVGWSNVSQHELQLTPTSNCEDLLRKGLRVKDLMT